MVEDDDSHDEPITPFDERIASVNNNDPSVIEVELPNGEFEGEEEATEDQIRALFRGLEQNTHVRKLDLYWTPVELRRTVCQQLLTPLLEENSSLRYLRFPDDMTNGEFLPSVDALCNNNNNTTMETLSLRGCDICGRKGGEMIGRLIRDNHHITSIDLHCNRHVGPAGAVRIAAALVDDDCALKTLHLDLCGIGDEGVDALCTALQVNNSLEKIDVVHNGITEEGYRSLAGSLPHMSGLKEIHLEWEQRQVSAAVLQQMIDGLRKNQSLQRITTYGIGKMSAEQRRKWAACCAFVGARNKMNGHLDGVRDAARDGSVAPLSIPICSLLWWCRHHEDAEVQDSLVFHVLRSNADKILGLADAAVEDG